MSAGAYRTPEVQGYRLPLLHHTRRAGTCRKAARTDRGPLPKPQPPLHRNLLRGRTGCEGKAQGYEDGAAENGLEGASQATEGYLPSSVGRRAPRPGPDEEMSVLRRGKRIFRRNKLEFLPEHDVHECHQQYLEVEPPGTVLQIKQVIPQAAEHLLHRIRIAVVQRRIGSDAGTCHTAGGGASSPSYPYSRCTASHRK